MCVSIGVNGNGLRGLAGRAESHLAVEPRLARKKARVIGLRLLYHLQPRKEIYHVDADHRRNNPYLRHYRPGNHAHSLLTEFEREALYGSHFRPSRAEVVRHYMNWLGIWTLKVRLSTRLLMAPDPDRYLQAAGATSGESRCIVSKDDRLTTSIR